MTLREIRGSRVADKIHYGNERGCNNGGGGDGRIIMTVAKEMTC